MTALPAPAAALLEALREARPSRLLVIGAGAAAAAADGLREERPETSVRLVPEPRDLGEVQDGPFDLAVVADVVGRLAGAECRQLLGALRDRYARRILLLAPRGAWALADYLALGFERRGEASEGSELYWYDMDRSNPEREWNNPDHWANPENFHRYRW